MEIRSKLSCPVVSCVMSHSPYGLPSKPLFVLAKCDADMAATLPFRIAAVLKTV